MTQTGKAEIELERKIFTIDNDNTGTYYGNIPQVGIKSFDKFDRENVKEYAILAEMSMKNCDYVVVSADSILEHYTKYNKDITMYLVMRAYQLNKPVYLLANSNAKANIRKYYPFLFSLFTDTFVCINELIDHLNEF